MGLPILHKINLAYRKHSQKNVSVYDKHSKVTLSLFAQLRPGTARRRAMDRPAWRQASTGCGLQK